jgi:hypothetical protein
MSPAITWRHDPRVRRSLVSLAAVCSMLPALSGCGIGDATGSGLPAAAAAGSGPASAPAATSAAARPALCDGRKPAPRDPFPFNRDATRRDGMLHFYDAGGDPGGERYVGGTAFFDSLDSATLAALIEARFIDPYDRQNAAPTAWEILGFLCRHPQVRAMGYVTSIERPDYRTSLETVYAGEIDAELRADALKFCVDAEGLATDDHLECFWD